LTATTSKYRKLVQTASLIFALIIAFWIPSYRWVLSDFIVAWILFSVLEFQFKKRFKQNVKGRFKNLILVMQLLLFATILSEFLFAEDKNIITKNIVQKLSFLIFPLLFSFSGTNFKTKKDLFLKLFVFSNLIMSLICLGVASYHSLSFIEGKVLFQPHYLSYRSYFTQSDLSVFHHRSYFSMYIVFSIAILFYLAEKQHFFNTKIKKMLFLLILLFFSIIILLLASRAGILSLFLLFVWLVIQKIALFENIIYKILAGLLIVIMLFFVSEDKRIQNTVKQISIDKNKRDYTGKGVLARPVLWAAALDIIKENFFTGIGTEKFNTVYKKSYQKYRNKKLSLSKSFMYNVHNQFLEEFVLYGIFGFLLLLALFVYPIIISFKKNNNLFMFFLLIAGFNFLFESMFDTIAGIVFFSFFLNYFIFVFDDTNEKIKITE